MTAHSELVARLERGERSNALDVLIEIAMFEPCEEYTDAVSNNAGTKVIYSKAGGGFETCLAREWVREPLKSKALNHLRAKEPQPDGEKTHGEGDQ